MKTGVFLRQSPFHPQKRPCFASLRLLQNKPLQPFSSTFVFFEEKAFILIPVKENPLKIAYHANRKGNTLLNVKLLF